MEWRVKQFRELTLDELYGVLKLRNEVFVVEQACVYQDMDGHDQAALHVIGIESGEILAYCRLLPPGEKYPEWGIGRVVTAKSARQRKLGHELMKQALAAIQQQAGQSVRISAQAHLEKFYGSHGFRIVSDLYDEDGIPHLEMLRETEV